MYKKELVLRSILNESFHLIKDEHYSHLFIQQKFRHLSTHNKVIVLYYINNNNLFISINHNRSTKGNHLICLEPLHPELS